MTLVELLYNFTILPIEQFLKYAYLFFAKNAGGFFFGLIWLSVLTSLLMAPLKKLAQKLGRKEERLQSVLRPQLDLINKTYSGEQQHYRIQKLYKTYGYHPILAIRTMLGLFLQVPFLVAAFYMLIELPEIKGVSFWVLQDLSLPDQLWRTSLGAVAGSTYLVNVLPYVMTLINVLAIFTSTSLDLKKILQGGALAAIFLILLYDAPAALLIFWTGNNLISLATNFYKGAMAEAPMIRVVYQNLKILPRSLQGVKAHLWILEPSFYVAIFFLLLQRWADRHGISKVSPILLVTILYATVQAIRRYRGRDTKGGWLGLLSSNLLRLVCLTVFTAAFFLVSDRHMMFLSAVGVLFSTCLPTSLNFSLERLKSFGLPLLAILTVFVFYTSSNHELLSLSSLLITFVAAIALLVFVAILSTFVASKMPKKYSYQQHSMLLVCMILTWGFFPGIIRTLSIHRPQPIFFLVCFLLLVFILYSFVQARRRLVVPFLLAFAAASPFVFDVWGVFSDPSLGVNPDSIFDLTDEMKNLSFKEKNNVYLLVYDGFPQPEVFEKLNLEFSSTKELLDKNNFKIYDKAYSLGRMSHMSMASLLNLSELLPERRMLFQSIAGAGRLWKIFKQNSYTTVNIQAPTMVAEYMYTDYLAPWQGGLAYKYAGAHDLLLSVFLWEFRFNLMSPLGEPLNYGPEADRVFDEAHAQYLTRDMGPKFFSSHTFRPGHTANTPRCLKSQRESFQGKIDEAVGVMRENIQSILEVDPSAIIVVLSDHGAQLAGDCSIELETFKANEVTELMFWDRYGTLLAIRWPDSMKARQYDSDLRLIQDIGPTILAYLSDSKEPLKWKPPRNITYKKMEFVRQGVLTLPSEAGRSKDTSDNGK